MSLLVPILALLLGVVLSLVLVGLARMYPPVREKGFYAVGLMIAALVYVVFAVAGGAGAKWLAFETLGVFLYGAAAWAGLRGMPWLLAVGWAAHVAWDVLLHLSGAGAEFTPHWYPWFCVGFDLVIAGAVLASSRRAVADRQPSSQ